MATENSFFREFTIYGSYLTDRSYHINAKRTMFLYSDQGACFPSMAKVKLENGKTVTMSELQTGDRVQTGMTIKMFQIYIIIHL